MATQTMDHATYCHELYNDINKIDIRAVPKSPATPDSMPDVNIIDIRGEATGIDLKEEILTSLKPEHGPKRMPTMLLYDEGGLQLFEKVRASFVLLHCC